MSDSNVPIVIDVGSSLTKVGRASEALPQHVFPSVVSMPKNFHRSSEMPVDAIKFGFDAERERLLEGATSVAKFPVEWGVITNWELFEDLMEHILYDAAGVQPEDTLLMLTEPPLCPKVTREKYTQLMFERFDVPGLYLANTASLTAHAAGVLDGVVLECGHHATFVAPVYDGVALRHAIPKFMCSANDIEWHLMKLLDKKFKSEYPEADWNFYERKNVNVVRDILNKHCRFALNYQEEMEKADSEPMKVSYTLPDGKELKLSTELVECTERLFDPSIANDEVPSLSWHVRRALSLVTSPEVRDAVARSVVVGGAVTTLPGFTQRLKKEVTSELSLDGDAVASAAPSVKVVSPDNRQYSAWVGGAVVASLPDFDVRCISKEEYDEHGPVLVHKKCFWG